MGIGGLAALVSSYGIALRLPLLGGRGEVGSVFMMHLMVSRIRLILAFAFEFGLLDGFTMNAIRRMLHDDLPVMACGC